ncbi:MAG: hypothetical protein WBA86_23630 [Nodosilinea sp.]
MPPWWLLSRAGLPYHSQQFYGRTQELEQVRRQFAKPIFFGLGAGAKIAKANQIGNGVILNGDRTHKLSCLRRPGRIPKHRASKVAPDRGAPTIKMGD